ncbi:hypothetical protein QC763_0008910 [Podospora pseudopauciseta]|uniref:Secreted protein n=2 Tax=Podospora TaxID=5144 RepID=A0ABR0HXY8_9PEZI|nr:hypothetical protein QC763_0008910 [Podospora pseudopauciseta]KAK4681434.1 hypothetical protein QC764_0008960 [Podospora pseudoanserina]
MELVVMVLGVLGLTGVALAWRTRLTRIPHSLFSPDLQKHSSHEARNNLSCPVPTPQQPTTAIASLFGVTATP